MKKFAALIAVLPLLLLNACGSDEESADSPAARYDRSLDYLKESGLFPGEPDAHTLQLIDSCRNDSVNGIPALLQASGKMFVLDLRSPQPSRNFAQYKLLHDALTKFFRELACDSSGMTFTLLDSEEEYSDTISRALDIYRKNKHYFRDLGDGVLPYSKNYEDTAFMRLDPDFWKVYNQLLAAEMTEQRLFPVPFRYIIDRDDKNRPVYREDPEKTGLVLLDRKQYEILSKAGVLGTTENEFNIFSPEQTVSLFGKLIGSGLVGEPDSMEQEQMLETLLGNSLYSKLDLYDFCDTSFCTLSFDTLNDIDPYTTMLQSLAGVSQMQFNPVNISEIKRSSDSAVVVSFYCDGGLHNYTYRSSAGMPDTHIFDDVNEYLRRRKSPGLFYTVGNTENTVTVIYIRPEQLDKARKSGLFDYIEPHIPAVLQKSVKQNKPIRQ